MQIKTDRLYIRQVTDEDFELISLIWRDWIPAFLRDNEAACNGLCHKLWEDMKDPVTLTGIIFLRDRNRFCGRVNMQKIDEEVPELGINIKIKAMDQRQLPPLRTGMGRIAIYQRLKSVSQPQMPTALTCFKSWGHSTNRRTRLF